MGVNKGMMACLRNDLDLFWFLAIHCFSHHFELAVADAFDQLFPDVNQILLDVYYHFRNSPTEWSNCKKLAAGIGARLIQPNKSNGTRFICHKERALYS